MIPIFEYKDIFNGNSLKPSADPRIIDIQETIEYGLVNGEILADDRDGYAEQYVVTNINEYDKYYIFSYLGEKYPNYGFLTNVDNAMFLMGDFITIGERTKYLDVKKLD
jgi:hypothetical protein